MTPALRLLATLFLLLPLSVPAKAQLSLYGFNWSMNPSEAMEVLSEDWSEALTAQAELLMGMFWLSFRGCEHEDCRKATMERWKESLSSDPYSHPLTPYFVDLMEVAYPQTKAENPFDHIDDLLASEAFKALIDQHFNLAIVTSYDANALTSLSPEYYADSTLVWPCQGDHDHDWVLNYGGNEGRFCKYDTHGNFQDLADLQRYSPEFSEPWIAFTCTKFDGCEKDDIEIADEVFGDPDIKDQLEAVGERYEYHDFGLCRQVISGERLCVLNSHIILFKGAYQQGQEPAASSSSEKSQCSSANPRACTTQYVCTFAANGNPKRWATDGTGLIFADEAMRRGQTCGVVEQAPECTPSNVSACSSEQLCERGTYGTPLRWYERISWSEYADEAKRRGLTCGVGEAAAGNTLNDLPTEAQQDATSPPESIIDRLRGVGERWPQFNFKWSNLIRWRRAEAD